MARLNRVVVPHHTHHIFQKSIDNQIIFKDDQDHLFFLDCLKNASKKFEVLIHAYVLMPNCYHILVTPTTNDGISKMIQWIGRHYVPYFNKKYQRNGTLWQGRFKTNLIEASMYLMLFSQYIELNPVYLKLVTRPDDYVWSSYLHHIGAEINPIITDHILYWALGNTPFAREAAYRALLDTGLTRKNIQDITVAISTGWALGTDSFKESIELQIKQRIQPAQRGRPRLIN